MLVLATALMMFQGQVPETRFEYDRVTDVSSATSDLGLVLLEPEHAAGMALIHQWEGRPRGPVAADADVTVFLYSASEYWTYPKNESMAILAGDVRIRPRAVDRERRVRFKLAGVPVTEVIVYRMSFADLSAIADASSVEMAVGPKRWSLSATQIQAIRRCVAHLKVSSEESNRLLAREAEAQRRAAEASAAAVAARRSRLDTIRPDFEEVLEQARKAASRLPKSRRDLRDKAKWKTYDNAVGDVISKHKATKDEIDELLKDYPDFSRRFTIR